MDKYTCLKQYFGHTSFRGPQEVIIDKVLAGRETIAILPTGFGKSLTFQLPALLLQGLTIVISPLIALMEDQVFNLKAKGISAATINSNQTKEEQKKLFDLAKIGKLKLLYVSAERLNNKRFKDFVSTVEVSFLVVDEAHTILWGESFREAFMHICDFIAFLPKRPKILALTATATPLTIKKIQMYLDLKDPYIITLDVDRPNISYQVYRPLNKFHFLLKYLKKWPNSKGIIYCLTRKTVENLAFKLKNEGIKVAYYHGGMDPDIKEITQKLFIKGKYQIIVCTNAFGMGIDIYDIRFVINYEIPQNLEDLVQQMGRAARDGGYAEGIVLFDFQDIKTIEYFINNIAGDDKEIVKKSAEKKLDQIVDYCLSKQCRHQFISYYFGQESQVCSKFCDNCKKSI